jgi:uncharacterized protein (DUF305 family)
MAVAATVLGVVVSVAACGAGATSTAAPSSQGAGAVSGMTSGAAAAAAPPMMSSPGTTQPLAPVTPGPAATGAHNAADAAFATAMISHHGQAVQMSDMLLARSSNPTVKALAEKIKAAQAPEMATMSGWLKGWGQPVPDPYASMDNGMGGMAMKGIMTQAQMHQLNVAAGPQADRVFLTLMPDHHRGAIEMSTTELAAGANPEAKKLARSIITSQTAEINQMKSMLTSLG